MKKFFCLLMILRTFSGHAQNNSAYLEANAVRIDNPGQLSDSIYKLLSRFRIIMVGEMHGTNEPAEFVIGLAKLLAEKNDSVSVGLEIPPQQMEQFLASRTDSSIYRSDFFSNAISGRESCAWAKVISKLKNNPRIQVFFYDVNAGEGKPYERDSMMYVKLKKQFLLHPTWKMITLSGNVHNRISPEEKKMAAYLKQDEQLNLSAKICSINHYYLQGTCLANFGKGLQEKKLGRPINEYDTVFTYSKYLVLMSAKSTYPFNGMYYTRDISAADMVKGNVDLPTIKKDLAAIFERDQKTRSSGDSTQFMRYIDSCNLAQVEPLISRFGWPGKSLLGGRGNYTVFLVIQHADSAVQEKYLPMLERSVSDSESRPIDLAYLQDRVFMRRGEKQIYGSQVILNKTGGQEFYPIADEKNVNIRRTKIGLLPMEEYAKNFGIEYKLPKE